MKKKTISDNKVAPQNPTPGKEHGNDPELAQPHGPLPHAGKHQLEFTYVNSPPVPIEPLVTKKTLCEHYHMALRTLDYAIVLGLPKVQVGALVRFRLSEVQPWFEKNGYRRFASEGRKAAVEKALLKSKQFQFALDGGVHITTPHDKEPKPSKSKSSKK